MVAAEVGIGHTPATGGTDGPPVGLLLPAQTEQGATQSPSHQAFDHHKRSQHGNHYPDPSFRPRDEWTRDERRTRTSGNGEIGGSHCLQSWQ